MRPIYDLASVFADQIRTAESESAARVYEPVIGHRHRQQGPEKLGRVKVKFPSSDKDQTDVLVPDHHARRRQEPRLVLHPRGR